jgi:hypothetical protein
MLLISEQLFLLIDGTGVFADSLLWIRKIQGNLQADAFHNPHAHTMEQMGQ